MFLKQAATVASGLAIALYLPSGIAATDPKAPAPASEFEPNAWVRIFPDGTVKLVVHKHDSGTGTQTALAACVAEELDVNPMTVQVITPEDPFFETYIHPVWKVFSTGGSTSVSLEYDRLRMAGATARALLITRCSETVESQPRQLHHRRRSGGARIEQTQPRLRRTGRRGGASASARQRSR